MDAEKQISASGSIGACRETGLHFDLPAHQLRQQEVAGGAEFLVLRCEIADLRIHVFHQFIELALE
jgi:hypothetical protein